MKRVFVVLVFLCFGFGTTFGQKPSSASNKFRTFSRPEVNYVFGINDDFNDQKINSLHVKLVIGLANAITGFGLGLENATYKAASGSGASFQTLNFSGNAHILAKPIVSDELNYFVKIAVGYAPKILREYNKGFNYQVCPGVLFTTKKGGKFFVQAVYNYQEVAGFGLSNEKPQIKGVGLGIGTWF